MNEENKTIDQQMAEGHQIIADATTDIPVELQRKAEDKKGEAFFQTAADVGDETKPAA